MNLIFKTEAEKRSHLEKSLKRFFPTFQNGGKIFRDLIQGFANPEAIVLDAGCGDGGVLMQYKSMFRSIIGVDDDQNLLDKNFSLDQKFCADLSHIPLPDQSVDLVSCDFVLEHLQNPQVVFSEIHRVLKPNGVFLFRTTNVYNPIMLLSKYLPFFLHKLLREQVLKKEEETHETCYRANTWNTLRRLGTESKFSSMQLYRAGNPEYLGFSTLTIVPAILLEKCFDVPRLHWMKMYLIGVYKK